MTTIADRIRSLGNTASRTRPLRARLRCERGAAVPVALMVTFVGMGLGVAALVATVHAQRGSVRDQERKAAIAAADAGVTQALFRENKIVTTESLKCLILGTGGLIPGAPLPDGWCPPVSGTVGNSTFTYRVKPWTLREVLGQQQRELSIVSIGTNAGVSRRVAVTAVAPTGVNILGSNKAVGEDWVRLDGTSETHASTGSNGNVFLQNNALLCGDARHGIGASFRLLNNAGQCSGYTVSEGLMLTPPPDQTDVLLNNSNGRLFGPDPATGNANWDPVTRTLSLNGNATVTLGGSDYSFCRLDMGGNSRLIMAAGARVRVFFDTPENCGIPEGAKQVNVTGTAAIESSSFDPSEPDITKLPGFFLVGSPDRGTLAFFFGTAGGGSVTQELFLYGPRTQVKIDGTTNYNGGVAGKTLHVDGTSTLTAQGDGLSPSVGVEIVYVVDRYVECTGGTGTPPNANC